MDNNQQQKNQQSQNAYGKYRNLQRGANMGKMAARLGKKAAIQAVQKGALAFFASPMGMALIIGIVCVFGFTFFIVFSLDEFSPQQISSDSESETPTPVFSEPTPTPLILPTESP